MIPMGQNGKEGDRFSSDKREWATNQNQQQKMFRLSLKPITFLKISEMYSLMSTNNPEDIFSTSIVMIQFAIYWEQ